MKLEVRDPVSRIVGYIGSSEKNIFSWLHYCPDRPTTDTAVVVCPPLGVEYMNSHRPLRHIADEYARAGIPALRFDYLGTGNSDDTDPQANQLETQLDSILIAIEAVKRETGARSVGLFGFRYGATLAALVSQQREIGFLSLWAPIVKGRQYLREIKLLQQMNTEQESGGTLEAGGIAINAATEQAIRGIDLLKLLPDCLQIQVIPADEVAEQNELCDNWRQGERRVTHLELEGSAGMLVDAHNTQVPLAEISRLVEDSSSGLERSSPSLSISERETLATIVSSPGFEQAGANGRLKEFAHSNFRDKTFYLVTESEQARSELPLVIFLNSGSNHHVGPNRIYVTICRQLAHLGFTCARVDLPGLGDGFIDDLEQENLTYLPDLTEHIGRVIAEIGSTSAHGQIVLAGLCSGAYGAFVSSIELPGYHIMEGVLINPLTFYWEDGMTLDLAPSREYQHWNWYMRSLRQLSRWQKLFRGDVNFGFLFRSIMKRIQIKLKSWKKKFRPHRKQISQESVSGHLPADLAQVERNNIHLSLFLADNDPGFDILMTDAGSSAKHMIKNGSMSVYLIENADHTFSMESSRSRAISLITEHLRSRYITESNFNVAGTQS